MKWNIEAGKKKRRLLLFLVVFLAVAQIFILSVDNGYASVPGDVVCTDYDGGGYDYKTCSLVCGSADAAYSFNINLHPSGQDLAEINGGGLISAPGGVYPMTLQCSNGSTNTVSIDLYYWGGDPSYMISFSDVTRIPIVTPPPVPAVQCSDYDGGGYDYKTCSLPCGPGDAAYSFNINLHPSGQDLAEINGGGLISAPGGVYPMTLQCSNGSTNTVSIDLYYWGGDPSYMISFSDVTRISSADAQPPVLTLSTLPDGSFTNNNALNVSGRATDNIAVQSVTVNGNPVTANLDGTFSTVVILAIGPNTITIVAVDAAGNHTTDTRTITLDQTVPVISIATPADNSVTSSPTVTVTGSVDKPATVLVKVGTQEPAAAQMTGTSFSLAITLAYNQNTIEVTAIDAATNRGTAVRTVTLDNVNPSLAITSPAQDISINQNTILLQGTVSDITPVTVRIAFDGTTYTPAVTSGTFQQQLTFTTQKLYSAVVTATNAAGLTTTVTRNIIYDTAGPYIGLNIFTTPTSQPTQTISGTREAGATVSVTSPTATAIVTYPSDTTWAALLTLQPGDNGITITGTDAAGNRSTSYIMIRAELPGALLCSDYDGGGYDYKNCSVVCGSGDAAYSFNINLHPSGQDMAEINGGGLISAPGGVYPMTLQCSNGSTNTVSIDLYYWGGDPSYMISFSDVTRIPIVTPPPVPAVTCTEYDGGGYDYKTCSLPCGPGDAAYSFNINLHPSGQDMAEINGGGLISAPGGVYPITLQCSNGSTNTVSIDLYYWGGDPSYMISFSDVTRIPIVTPPPVPAVQCSDYDGGGYDYKTCSLPCGPGDAAYSFNINLHPSGQDLAEINGGGLISAPGGVYPITLQCSNGSTNTVSIDLYYWGGDPSYMISFSDVTRVPN